MASSILMFALNVEDQLIVGHLLKAEDLAAVAIANTFFNIFWYLLVGLMSAIDTFSAQAYGAGQYVEVGLWAQRGLFICLVTCIPVVLFSLTCTEFIVLHVFQQDAIVASKAAIFVRWLMPGLPFFVLADVLRRWLQVQGHLRPAVETGVLVNLLNVGFNFLLVSNFGLIGSPIATSMCRVLQVVFLLLIIKYRGLHVRNSSRIVTWPTWSWSSVLQRKPITMFLKVAAPGAAMLLLEAGAFETSTIIVGRLGNLNVLDAHFVLLSLCGFSFVSFPLSVAIAGSIRVGHLLGASKPRHAKMAAWISVSFGAGFMAVNGMLFALLKDSLGFIFTDDETIAGIVARIALIAAAFQIVDGIQGTAAGALRGAGRQSAVACTNLLGFWILGVPVGLLLAFPAGMGVYGVWWGLTIGLAVAAGVTLWILCRIDWVGESLLAVERVTNHVVSELVGGGGSGGGSGGESGGSALLSPMQVGEGDEEGRVMVGSNEIEIKAMQDENDEQGSQGRHQNSRHQGSHWLLPSSTLSSSLAVVVCLLCCVHGGSVVPSSPPPPPRTISVRSSSVEVAADGSFVVGNTLAADDVLQQHQQDQHRLDPELFDPFFELAEIDAAADHDLEAAQDHHHREQAFAVARRAHELIFLNQQGDQASKMYHMLVGKNVRIYRVLFVQCY